MLSTNRGNYVGTGGRYGLVLSLERPLERPLASSGSLAATTTLGGG